MMALYRYWWCYLAWGWDDSLSLVVILFSLMVRWEFTYTGVSCSLMLWWQLFARGDVMQLEVVMTVCRCLWCYVAWGWDDSFSLVMILLRLILRCQLVATGDVMKLEVELAVFRWLWYNLALYWDGSWSLLVISCSLMLRWQLFAGSDVM